MEITLRHSTELEKFKNWVRIFSPLYHFREETEVPVLASLLLLYYTYSNQGEDSDRINLLLFHEDSKLSLRSKLGFSERSFYKTLGLLEEKGVIVNNQINLNFVPKEFKVTYNFESTTVNV